MNIGFPEPEHPITAFYHVGVCGLVALHVGLLNWVGRVGIDRRVAMPEIPVPLHNDVVVCQQRINDEFSTNDMLFDVEASNGVKDRPSRPLQGVRALDCGKPEDTVDARHIPRVVATFLRTVFCTVSTPSGDVEWFLTCWACGDSPTAADRDGHCTSGTLGTQGVLPRICASHRTEADRAATTGYETVAAVAAGVCATTITPFSGSRTWGELLVAFFARAWSVGHVVGVPWRVV